MAKKKPVDESPTASDPVPDFEAALGELETLVERMEQGDLSLEQSLAAFEQGVSLTRTCQQALQAAEQRVEILRADATAPEPFDPPADADRDADA